jgi:hypothetical protein
MITKRIVAPKGGSGYQRLSGYVLNVRSEHRERTDPASWTRLGAYILDADHEGEKVAWARATNCGNDDPGWAVRGIVATQARNTRSQGDKSYHLVVSFPEGERPTREQMEDIENRLCAVLGFEEHQRVSAVHQNTDNWHLHVAINKVHPASFRNVSPRRDFYRLQEACAELEIRHALTREPHTLDPQQSIERDQRRARGRAADFEARHGGQSFAAWVQERAGTPLLAARDAGRGWQEMHRAAAVLDLTVKLRGAGLVIGHRGDKRLHVKASDVDRGLSMKALTDALGPFEPPGQETEAGPAQASYAKPNRAGPLYEAFQRERAAADAARRAAMKALREQHSAHAGQLAGYHRERLREERLAGLRGVLRREGFQHLAGRRKLDHAERKARAAEERRQVREGHPVPSWQGFLEAEAARGNEDALKALRSRQQQRDQLQSQLLEATDAGEARHVIHQHLRPAVRRDGRVIYRVDDGGLVSDEAKHVRVSQVTTGAAFLALTLAADRFGARPLKVQGTEDFRRQVAQLAGIKGMGVTFADAGMEQQRRGAAAERANVVDRGREGVDITRTIWRGSKEEGRER